MTTALIRELVARVRVRPPPAELRISIAEATALAVHASAVGRCDLAHRKASELLAQICAGKLQFYKVPVRLT